MSISSVSSQNPYVSNYAPTSANTTIKAKVETKVAETAVVADAPVVINTAKLNGDVNGTISKMFSQSLQDAFDPNKQNMPQTPASKALGEFMGNLFKASMKDGNNEYASNFHTQLSDISKAIRNESIEDVASTDATTSSSTETASTDTASKTATSSQFTAIEDSYKNLVNILGGTYNKAELSNFLDSFGSSFNIVAPKGNMVNATA